MELAEPLGRMLAAIGVHLLTGGGRGVMESVSRAFHDAFMQLPYPVATIERIMLGR